MDLEVGVLLSTMVPRELQTLVPELRSPVLIRLEVLWAASLPSKHLFLERTRPRKPSGNTCFRSSLELLGPQVAYV